MLPVAMLKRLTQGKPRAKLRITRKQYEGRQPWMVVGLQTVASAVSPNITAAEVWLTMIGFTVIYLLLAIAAVYLAIRYIKKESALALEGGKH